MVCPTDSIEQLILDHFKGEAFFYTALGVYFTFDFEGQASIKELIDKQNIKQIILVTSIDNVFYKHAFDKSVKHHFPIDEALKETKKKIFKHLMYPDIFPSNIHLLAASHLAKQKQRLLSTPYLGGHLRKERIMVKAYVYQPLEKVFYSLQEIKQRGNLVNSYSYN